MSYSTFKKIGKICNSWQIVAGLDSRNNEMQNKKW